ncbi:flavin monoamine oxidase family protein [Novosphingobium jiangmenense]|uniref:FAD-dependent oxidoreductase n=1 Tax=Novosphingobium jiangmenense TaxID=2791981 RepID=A0ABS0HAT4_9SPHN|nr:FAD-dependent oxidoreductase [Novosphingobium jiangmenense]MBF9149392.1 FAD-dependent oxidoreductase [Novosphingobium jiangmenense]
MTLNRRQFVGTGLAAGAALGLPRMAFAAEKADVVIIGAGLSGLRSAEILTEQGLKVLVIDANTRVGGRVQTVQTADGPIDVGASQIGRGYARVIDACQRHGLKLVSEDRDLLAFGSHFAGQWIDGKTWATNPLNLCEGDERKIPPNLIGQALASKYNPLEALDDWLDPRFAEYDISLRELLVRKGHSAQAIELAAYSAPGIGIDETSVLRMWQEEVRSRIERRIGEAAAPAAAESGPKREHPFGEANDHREVGGLAAISNIVGGCSALPLAMAAKLGDRVRLGKRAQSIALSDTGGTVTCSDGSTYSGRFLICTLPFSMLREVEITGSANPIARQAITTMPYANTARLYVTVERPFWKEDGLPPSISSDGPMGMFWAIDNHTGEGAHRGMFVLVGRTAQAVSALDRGEAEAMLIAELARLRPASKGAIRVATWKDWLRDPLQRGCGFSLAPGQVNAFARDMVKPWQVMHFAGEHTRRTDFGMESAMESGERAAIEVLERTA